jgi:hypothetical protein
VYAIGNVRSGRASDQTHASGVRTWQMAVDLILVRCTQSLAGQAIYCPKRVIMLDRFGSLA